MLSRNHDGRDRTHWLDERGQPACWNAHQECAEHKVAVLTAANTALSERLAAVTAALTIAEREASRKVVGGQGVRMCRLCDQIGKPIDHAPDCPFAALAAGQPAPAAAGEA